MKTGKMKKNRDNKTSYLYTTGVFLRQFCLFKALLTLPIKGRKKKQKGKKNKTKPYQIFISLLKLPEISSCFQWKRNCDSKTHDIHTAPGPALAQDQAQHFSSTGRSQFSLRKMGRCSQNAFQNWRFALWKECLIPCRYLYSKTKIYFSSFSKVSCDYISSPNPTSSVRFTSEQMWESIRVGET